MLIAAAVCPHPPALVPEMTGRAWRGGALGPGGAAEDARELNRLRAACDGAVAWLLAQRPDLLAVVGGAERSAEYPAATPGSLAPFGLPGGAGDGTAVLPLSLTIGRWLLGRAGSRADGRVAPDGPHPAQPIIPPPGQPGVPDGTVEDARAAAKVPSGSLRAAPGGPGTPMPEPRTGPSLVLMSAARSAPRAECLALGAELASRAPRVALLVMGDGTGRRARGLPGAADPEAERYDAGVAAALAAADAAALAGLDPGLSADLFAAGRAAWQVLAGAAEASGNAGFHGGLRYSATPFEVTYFVATWHRVSRREAAPRDAAAG